MPAIDVKRLVQHLKIVEADNMKYGRPEGRRKNRVGCGGAKKERCRRTRWTGECFPIGEPRPAEVTLIIVP